MNKIVLTALVLSQLGVPALAQSGAALDAAATAHPEAPVDAAAPPSTPTEAAADESIYVVQRRVYSKSGKLEITPLFYTSLNNKFVGHLGLGVALAYHVRENFAIEVSVGSIRP